MADWNRSSVDTNEDEDYVDAGSSSIVKTKSVAVAAPGGHGGGFMAGPFPNRSPSLDYDNSDESPAWSGCHPPAQTHRPMVGAIMEAGYSKTTPGRLFDQAAGRQIDMSPVLAQGLGPAYWKPFQGNVAYGSFGAADGFRGEHQGMMAIRAVPLPSTFRLERSNFLAKTCHGGHLSAKVLAVALRTTFDRVGIDILEFRHAHCVFECSYHQGNKFLNIYLRVFKPPMQGDMDESDDEGEDGNGLIVEAQLREGDKLHFTALFRDVMKVFKTQDEMALAGSLRYKVRTPPARGEELVLEEASLYPSRNSVRLLAEQNEVLTTAPTPTAGVRRMLAKSGVPPGGSVLTAGAALPLPAEMASEKREELDGDVASDVKSLACMLSGKFVDVQADAATAVAGLTADEDLLRQLSHPSAADASKALCSAAARLLVETLHRPARRQAAVLVANLSTTPELRAALLASDPPPESDEPPPRRLLEALVAIAMGDAERAAKPAMRSMDVVVVQKEEEIGTRRECMRALACFAADHRLLQGEPAIDVLRSSSPTGRGATDRVLGERLRQCRYDLSRPDAAAPSTCA